MKIECYLIRKGGTHVLLDDISYHFAPSKDDPRHTAEVTDKVHAQRFLKIDEAYRIADDLEPVKPVVVLKAAKAKESAPAFAVS